LPWSWSPAIAVPLPAALDHVGQPPPATYQVNCAFTTRHPEIRGANGSESERAGWQDDRGSAALAN
jgi:hypothetical protein